MYALKGTGSPVQEEGAGMLRPGVPLTNVPMDSNQQAGSQLSHGVRLANGEFDKSSPFYQKMEGFKHEFIEYMQDN